MKQKETFDEKLKRLSREGQQRSKEQKPTLAETNRKAEKEKDEIRRQRPGYLVREHFEQPFSIKKAFDYYLSIARQFEPRYAINNANEPVIKNCIYWLFGHRDMRAINPANMRSEKADVKKGLLIVGGTGTGKTLILKILNELWKVDRPEFYSPINGKFNELRYRIYRSQDITETYRTGGSPAIQPIKTKPIIGIDDIGSEAPEAAFMGSKLNVIHDVLMSRFDGKGLLTVATSNLGYESLKDIYGDRLFSRLHENFNLLILRGNDWRQTV